MNWHPKGFTFLPEYLVLWSGVDVWRYTFYNHKISINHIGGNRLSDKCVHHLMVE